MRGMVEEKDIRFMCCFCEKGMKKPEITIINNSNGQNWWSHKKCLEQNTKIESENNI